MLRWKEKAGILVTCADCEFVSDCDDVKEDYGVCRYFQLKTLGSNPSVGSNPTQSLADKKTGEKQE